MQITSKSNFITDGKIFLSHQNMETRKINNIFSLTIILQSSSPEINNNKIIGFNNAHHKKDVCI
jgi:hypothetical protein